MHQSVSIVLTDLDHQQTEMNDLFVIATYLADFNAEEINKLFCDFLGNN